MLQMTDLESHTEQNCGVMVEALIMGVRLGRSNS